MVTSRKDKFIHFLHKTSMVWKAALGSGMSWEIASWAGSDHPFLAPITVILCLQGNTQKSVMFTIKRVFGTLFGIILILLSMKLLGPGDQAWKMILLLFVGLGLMKALKMDPLTMQEAALSIVLVLALSHDSSIYSIDRARDTVIGAIVVFIFLVFILPANDYKKAKNLIANLTHDLSQYALSIGQWIQSKGSDQKPTIHHEYNIKSLFHELQQTFNQMNKTQKNLRFNPYAKDDREAIQRDIESWAKVEKSMLYLIHLNQTLRDWVNSGTMKHSDRIIWSDYMQQLSHYFNDWDYQVDPKVITVIEKKLTPSEADIKLCYEKSAEHNLLKLLHIFKR